MLIALRAITSEIQMTFNSYKNLFKMKTNSSCQLSKYLKVIKTTKILSTRCREFLINQRLWVSTYKVSKRLHFIMSKTDGRSMFGNSNNLLHPTLDRCKILVFIRAKVMHMVEQILLLMGADRSTKATMFRCM